MSPETLNALLSLFWCAVPLVVAIYVVRYGCRLAVSALKEPPARFSDPDTFAAGSAIASVGAAVVLFCWAFALPHLRILLSLLLT